MVICIVPSELTKELRLLPGTAPAPPTASGRRSLATTCHVCGALGRAHLSALSQQQGRHSLAATCHVCVALGRTHLSALSQQQWQCFPGHAFENYHEVSSLGRANGFACRRTFSIGTAFATM